MQASSASGLEVPQVSMKIDRLKYELHAFFLLINNM